MEKYFKNYFREKNLLQDQQLKDIENYESNGWFTLKNELRFFLYTGILLFVSGAGILIYQNIDTIGHQIILLVLSVICAYSFYWAWNTKGNYSNEEVKHNSTWTDHVLMLSCLLFGVIEAYAHIQYGIFGNYYSIGILIPAFIFIPLAYVFDHRGVLSLGLTTFISWIGIGFSPYDPSYIFSNKSEIILLKSILTGLALVGLVHWLNKKKFKIHFSQTYHNFAVHLIAAAALYGMFDWEYPTKLIAIIILAAAASYYIKYAREEASYYFILVAVIYAYIGFTYLVFSWMDNGDTIFFFGMLYMMASSAGIILFFINLKKMLNKKSGM